MSESTPALAVKRPQLMAQQHADQFTSAFIKRVHELLHYDPATGLFTWRVDRRRARAGDVAGAIRGLGYLAISIDGVQFYAHRLAFLMMNGMWPSRSVDHIDGRKTNNAWVNLRDVSHAVNMQNQHRARVVNSTGLLGAARCREKFKAEITVNGVFRHLGVFQTPGEAHAAYLAAKQQLQEHRITNAVGRSRVAAANDPSMGGAD
ncbi:hypothetical protein D3C71_1552600 [compost metagenome]